MRISDWSSDVCSSDLPARRSPGAELRLPRAWPLRAAGGPSLQSQQAAAGSLRQGSARRASLARRRLRLPRRASARGPGDGPAQLRLRHAEVRGDRRSEEHTSELQSLMRISYAVFCLKKKTKKTTQNV